MAPSPSPLEQLGALGSLLVHDMANHMCIISGNATFAQMVLQDPAQLNKAVEAIAKAGERMSFILSQCGDFRRTLGEQLPRGGAAETVAGVRQVFAAHPGWSLEVAGEFQGPLLVPTAWAVFAVQQVLAEIQVPTGSAKARRVQMASDTTFLLPFGGAYVEVRLHWESDRPFSIEEIRGRYDNVGILASFELIRQCGGKLEGYTPAPGHQEAAIIVPFETAKSR